LKAISTIALENNYLGRGRRFLEQSFLCFRIHMLGILQDIVPADRPRDELRAQIEAADDIHMEVGDRNPQSVV
jgi:hypothetical protein